MLRKALSLALTLAMVTLAVPATMLADNSLLGSVSGRAVDAAGRGVGSQRVELMQGGQVVTTTTTSAHGEWSFRDVKPGDYIVRMMVNGKVSGVQVSIIAGQTMTSLLVLPTASVAPQLGSLATLLATLGPTAAASVTSIGFAQSVDTETTVVDEDILEQILAELTPAARDAFAEALLDAIESNPQSPYAQYEAQLEIIANSNGNTVPAFPPPAPVS